MIDDNWVSPVYLKSKCHPVVRIIIPENEDAGKRHSLCTVGIDPKKLFLFLGLKGLSRTCIYRKYMLFIFKMSIKCLKIDWKMVW